MNTISSTPPHHEGCTIKVKGLLFPEDLEENIFVEQHWVWLAVIMYNGWACYSVARTDLELTAKLQPHLLSPRSQGGNKLAIGLTADKFSKLILNYGYLHICIISIYIYILQKGLAILLKEPSLRHTINDL